MGLTITQKRDQDAVCPGSRPPQRMRPGRPQYTTMGVLRLLLDDHAAGDAVTGVAGRIVGEVVRFGMDNERSAAFVEERIRAIRECGARGSEADFGGSLRGNG